MSEEFDAPCDEWPTLTDMYGAWHVKTEANPGFPLGFAGVTAAMPAIMAYFERTGFA